MNPFFNEIPKTKVSALHYTIRLYKTDYFLVYSNLGSKRAIPGYKTRPCMQGLVHVRVEQRSGQFDDCASFFKLFFSVFGGVLANLLHDL